MSRNRVTPGRGYVIAALLPKGPNGRALCRWCRVEVKPPRRTFCCDACIHEWKLRSDPGYAKEQVWKRDGGRCAACGVVPPGAEFCHRDYSGTNQRGFRRFASAWAMDHIRAVEEGGGECGLDGLQTLCHPCHDAKSRAHHQRMERRRSIARQ